MTNNGAQEHSDDTPREGQENVQAQATSLRHGVDALGRAEQAAYELAAELVAIKAKVRVITRRLK